MGCKLSENAKSILRVEYIVAENVEYIVAENVVDKGHLDTKSDKEHERVKKNKQTL